jgi:hypothetical protein
MEKELLFINISDYETTAKNSYAREVIDAFRPHFSKIHIFCLGRGEIIKDRNLIFYCGNLRYWNGNLNKIRKRITDIHAQDLFLGGYYAYRASKKLGIGYSVRCGGIWRYKLNSISKVIKHLIAKYTQIIVLKNADNIVFNSRSIVPKDYLHRSKVVYNGVDTSMFTPFIFFSSSCAGITIQTSLLSFISFPVDCI